MERSVIIFLLMVSIDLSGQKLQPNVEFTGNKNQVLLARKEAMKAPGKLTSGEAVKAGCDQGTCYFEIDYKGRTVKQKVGDDITRLTIYEYDFGADTDLEIVVVNEYKGTVFLFIFSYSKGIIQKLFEKEIKLNKVILKKDYIEYYLPGGEESMWHYYLGQFWEMTPMKYD